MRLLLMFTVFMGIAAMGAVSATEGPDRDADRATHYPPNRTQDPSRASLANGGILQCDIRRPSCRKWQVLSNDRNGESKNDN